MPKSILIVDDNPAVRTTTRCFLQNQFGVEVCGEAIDGLDALEKARHLKPDLIILDLSMPRMNGLQAAREIAVNADQRPDCSFHGICRCNSTSRRFSRWCECCRFERRRYRIAAEYRKFALAG